MAASNATSCSLFDISMFFYHCLCPEGDGQARGMAQARMEANAALGWTPTSRMGTLYRRSRESEWIKHNLAPGQKISDLNPLQCHPELHRIFAGNYGSMPFHRNSRSSSRSGYTPMQLRDLIRIHNLCRLEAIRLVSERGLLNAGPKKWLRKHWS